jgi:uncharacterized protein
MTAQDPKAVLDDADIERLQTLLMSRAVPAGGMNLEMLDGLLSGLLVGPADVPTSECQPLIWGSDVEWASPDEADQADRLVQRLARYIEARIEIDPDQGEGNFMPLVSMPAGLPDDPAAFDAACDEIDYPLGAAWAGGFLHAVDLRLPQWRIWEQQVEGLEECIGFLLRLIQLEPGAEDGSPPPTFRERVNMMAAMPYMLRILFFRRRSERASKPAGGRH